MCGGVIGASLTSCATVDGVTISYDSLVDNYLAFDTSVKLTAHSKVDGGEFHWVFDQDYAANFKTTISGNKNCELTIKNENKLASAYSITNIFVCNTSGVSKSLSIDANMDPKVMPASCYMFASGDDYGLITGLFDSDPEYTKMIIPAMINSQYVYGIGESAFFDMTLSSSTIPTNIESITFEPVESYISYTIRDGAFAACPVDIDLTNIDNLSYVGDGAFAGSKIEHFDLHTTFGVPSIGDLAFANCTVLENVEYPIIPLMEEITIGFSAFGGCTSLTSVDLAPTKDLGEFGIFASCSHLKKITFHSWIMEIGEMVFKACTSLTDAYIVAGVGSVNELNAVGDDAFADNPESGTTLHIMNADGSEAAQDAYNDWIINPGALTNLGGWALPTGVVGG